MLRGPLVQRGAGAVWTRFQGVCTCWLTSNQGGVRLVLMAATPLHFPGQNAQQERLQWCGTKSQGMNPGMELGLTVQKQPWRPGVWFWPQLRARYQHAPSRAGSGHSGLYQCADQWHQGDARVGWTLLGGRTPWCISLQEHPPTPNHSLELECGEQDLGEASNRYNPGPRLQHSPCDSCSRSDSTPSPSHTAALHQVWDEHIRERYMSLGCYWAELWKLA